MRIGIQFFFVGPNKKSIDFSKLGSAIQFLHLTSFGPNDATSGPGLIKRASPLKLTSELGATNRSKKPEFNWIKSRGRLEMEYW